MPSSGGAITDWILLRGSTLLLPCPCAVGGKYAVCVHWQNSRNQESLTWGKPPTPLKRLCCLPFKYFSEEKCGRVCVYLTLLGFGMDVGFCLSRYRRQLFPTLVAATADYAPSRTVIREEISQEMVLSFLKPYAEGIHDVSPSLAGCCS
jgi:hypothetical protein